MVDESETVPFPSGAAESAGASAATFAAAGASRTTADAFLEKQCALIDLQMEGARLQNENLRQQDEYELSHLRWRRFNDQMGGAVQIMLVVLGAAVVIAIGAAVWNATQAEGLVVDAFSVPPHFAQVGISGDVLADDLTHRIAAVRDVANANSIAHSNDVKQEREEDIKVDIPDTGISLGEVTRYLRSWLGHERHLGGDLRESGNGRIALTVSLDGADSATFSGSSGDLDKLEQQAAEHVFQGVDPSNYILYLSGMGRTDAVLPAVMHLIRTANSPGMLSDGYSLWGNETRRYVGDMALESRLLHLAAAIDPKALPPHMELMFSADEMGHDEEALQEAARIPGFRQEEQYAWREGRGFTQVLEQAALEKDTLTGDFVHALSAPCGWCSLPGQLLGRAEYAARMHDIRRSHALIDEAVGTDGISADDLNRARYFADWAKGDWQTAASDAQAYRAAIAAGNPRLTLLRASTQAIPLVAFALAREGDFAAAHREIDISPGDCVACETARGVIAGLENSDDRAAWWFARAVHDAPSIPFANSDWGEMLLRHGRCDAAIAQFRLANEKGPHFADPLEMWGEALMQENRSDLALAKFEEAAKYAPNWGRLHLEWGKALSYVGKKGEAQKQFQIAASLDLSAADKTTLADWMARHD